MSQFRYRPYYKRTLPHYQPPGAILFVTFRLAGSLPVNVIQRLREEFHRAETEITTIKNPQERARRRYEEQRRYFGKWDNALDTSTTGPFWLKDKRVADIVAKSLHFLNNERYMLDAYSIMSNHAHAVFQPLPKGDGYHSLTSIMHSIKVFTALESNKILNRSGQFWQPETYDHVVRDDAEWRRILRYVVYNPVKAGLVTEWNDWPWTYCRFDL